MTIEGKQYVFNNENGSRGETVDKVLNLPGKEIKITLVGSPEADPKENQKKFGKYIAEQIIFKVEAANRAGKKLVFDMATGNTPKLVWPALKNLIESGKVDLSNVIVIGHEEAWGTFARGSHSDFDYYRRERLTDNKLAVHEIVDPAQVKGNDLQGNFVPMHLTADPEESARRYADIISALHQREDVVFFGLYGVGVDGHFGELQVGAIGKDAISRRQYTYADDARGYSFDSEDPLLFRWLNEDGGFRPEDNLFWERAATDPKEVGRAARDDYRGIERIVGLGWREILEEESMLVAFNHGDKGLAFALAMEGSLSGTIRDQSGRILLKIEQDRGEGEDIFSELDSFGKELEAAQILEGGTTERIATSKKPFKSTLLIREMYKALDNKGARVTDGEQYYQRIWAFINRYVGRRAPVSCLLRWRALLGKETEMVITPEVVKGTKYEKTFCS